MDYGYFRSHKATQPFLDNILAAGVLSENVWNDSDVNSADALTELLENIQQDDRLFIENITHFAKSNNPENILSVVKTLMKRRVILVQIQEPYSMVIEGKEMFREFIKVFDAVLDIYRSDESEEHGELVSSGMRRAKEKGKSFGRKLKLSADQQRAVMQAMNDGGCIAKLAREYDISRTSLYNLKRKV